MKKIYLFTALVPIINILLVLAEPATRQVTEQSFIFSGSKPATISYLLLVSLAGGVVFGSIAALIKNKCYTFRQRLVTATLLFTLVFNMIFLVAELKYLLVFYIQWSKYYC